MIWHITVEIYGVKFVRNCFNRGELHAYMDILIDNECCFDVSWSKSVTE